MGVGIWKTLQLDRIHQTLKIKSAEEYGVLLGQLDEMWSIQKQFLPEGRIGRGSKGFQSWVNYFPRKKGRSIANLEVGIMDVDHRYIRLTMYPSNFQGNDFSKLKTHLNIFFGGGSNFYENLYLNARVSYIELAADSLTLQRNNLILFRRRTRCSRVKHLPDGTYGTSYLGSKASSLNFTLYDKAKELIERKLPEAGKYPIRTRIEAQLRHTNLRCPELLESLQNPFSDLEVASMKRARELTKCLNWQAFLDDCVHHGSAKALEKCDKTLRKQRLEMLRECREAHWNPGFVWGGLASALSVINPA